MGLSRSELFHVKAKQDEIYGMLANAPETYQEDRAFMNRNKALNLRSFHESDLRRLWRIALRGLNHRQKLEKEITVVENEISKRIEDNTINCGYKLSWKLEEELHRLKGLRS